MSGENDTVRAQARELLAEKRVEYVLGYEAGSDGKNARPLFARTPEEADRLIFDETCTHNLTTYLTESSRRGKKIGILVKPCDARSLIVLIQERQCSGDGVAAIPVTCPGIVERTREGGDGVSLQERCKACGDRAPMADGVVVGRSSFAPEVAAPFARVEEFERLSDAEREAFWTGEFERCIRCYACRQVCPACYCEQCFAETLDPEWVGIRMGANENWMFHTIRAFHLAGRCVGCDECERVCPVNIPLSLLNGKLRKEVLETFNYRAGISPDQAPPLVTFKKDEKLGVG
jgi:formate dehydrogenase (coenzyme F420) beta subunit